jgi:hypothetical protein
MGQMRDTYKILVGNLVRKIPVGRPSHGWEDVRLDLREIVWIRVDWIHLPQDRD